MRLSTTIFQISAGLSLRDIWPTGNSKGSKKDSNFVKKCVKQSLKSMLEESIQVELG